MAEIQNAKGMDLVRKLATILSADVAEYSRLMAQDEEYTLQIFRGHREVFEQLVTLHRGRIFNTAGDAILAEFSSAVEAVRCATEIQAALHTRNDQLPDDRQVRFRIGVNLGDVMLQGDDLLGDGVNVAARLQSAAEPGGICISGGVYDQIRNKLSLSFKPLGERKYKNIPQTVRTFAIAEAEGLGALPSPERRTGLRRWAFWPWIAPAAVLLVLIAGGVFWAYSDHQRRADEHDRQAAAEEARRRVESEELAAAAARQKAELEAQKLAAEQDRRQAEVERQAAEASRKQIAAELQRSQEAQRLAEAAPPVVAALPPSPEARHAPTAAEPALRVPTTPTSPAVETVTDGTYGGPICYGPTSGEPARCYRAQAVMQKGDISGQWPGRDPGVMMHLVGKVSPAGDVAIHMHGERPDGSRFALIDLSGRLREQHLDASGRFLNGRSVTLNWQKN